MSDYHLNLFRPYRSAVNDEMAITRAFVLACSRSPHGKRLFSSLVRSACADLATLDPEQTWQWDLEMPADHVREIALSADSPRFVLCITPTGRMAPAPWRTLLEGPAAEQHAIVLRRIVPMGDVSALSEFETYLRTHCQEVNEALASRVDLAREQHVKAAYDDVWRWLYAGARPDAVVRSSSFICLIESKLYWDVPEAQVRNHALKAFGTPFVPNCCLTWQAIHAACAEIATETGDPILEDLCSYLADKPNLVRWNGFDQQDRIAFAVRGGLEGDANLLTRLEERFSQCMEDLCEVGGYEAVVARRNDWDFQVPSYPIVGNLGIGNWEWGGECLAPKWIVGWRAANEIRELLGHRDLHRAGDLACENLVHELLSLEVGTSIAVEFRASQRFNFINANDSVGQPFVLPIEPTISPDVLKQGLRANWKAALAALQEFNARCGAKVDAVEALRIKRELSLRSDPQSKIESIQMATRHQMWKLFPTFEVFLWLAPEAYAIDSAGQIIDKPQQLRRLDSYVRKLATFARAVSR